MSIECGVYVDTNEARQTTLNDILTRYCSLPKREKSRKLSSKVSKGGGAHEVLILRSKWMARRRQSLRRQNMRSMTLRCL